MTNSNRIEKVVIVGGGTAGWMTAAALSKAFGKLVSIDLIESDEIGTVGVGEATIPQINNFNRFLDIQTQDFLAATKGTFKLGIEFRNWGHLGNSYIHTFGPIGMPLGFVEFQHYWTRARLNGSLHGLWAYSAEERMCRLNKFNPAEKIPNTPIPIGAHAYHFDAGLYAAYLRKLAEGQGVKRIEGRIIETSRDGETGDIASVKLDNNKVVGGELFIDCSGFRGLLIEQELHAGYEDWSHWLPMDRAVAVPCANAQHLTPYTRSTAHGAGWQWRIPLQHRIGNGHVFSSRFMSEDEATGILLSNLDGIALAEPRTLKFVTGRRKKSWDRNVIAVGLASGFLEPLESTSIHLIQTAIDRIIQYFPDRGFSAANRDLYNRLSAWEIENVRDFIILHYHLNQRTDTPFWIACRNMDVPERLKERMKVFEQTGRVLRENMELFTDPSWLQVLHGQGLTPQGYHPLADGLTDRQLDEFLGNIRNIIDRATPHMADHQAFIDALTAAQAA